MKEFIRLIVDDPTLVRQIDQIEVVPEDSLERVVVEVILELQKRGIEINAEIIAHELKAMEEDGDALAKLFRRRMKQEVNLTFEYILESYREDYNKDRILGMCTDAARMVKDVGSAETYEFINDSMRKVSVGGRPKDMTRVTEDSIIKLQSLWAGEKPAILKTGNRMYDTYVAQKKRQIIMVAAAQKSGKTRFTWNTVYKTLLHQPYVEVDWFSYEQHTDEMMLMATSMITGLDEGIITGELRMPTMKEQEMIIRTHRMIKNLPIKWYDQRMPIKEMIKQIYKSKAKDRLIVIDNHGLVPNVDSFTENQHDDNVIANLIDVRDKTDATIYLIHHLTKEVDAAYNKDNDYEPEIKHVRGSAKLVDGLNKLILLHRASRHKSLMAKLTREGKIAVRKQILIKMPINRGGSPAEYVMECDLAKCRFEDFPDACLVGEDTEDVQHEEEQGAEGSAPKKLI